MEEDNRTEKLKEKDEEEETSENVKDTSGLPSKNNESNDEDISPLENSEAVKPSPPSPVLSMRTKTISTSPTKDVFATAVDDDKMLVKFMDISHVIVKTVLTNLWHYAGYLAIYVCTLYYNCSIVY